MCDSRDTEMTYFVICINYSIIIKASLGQHPVTRAPTHSMGCCNKVEPNKTGERFVFFFSSFVSSWYPLLSVSKASSHSSNYAFNQSFNCTATQLINQFETQSVRQSDNHTSKYLYLVTTLFEWWFNCLGLEKCAGGGKCELWNWVVFHPLRPKGNHLSLSVSSYILPKGVQKASQRRGWKRY